MKSFTVKLEGPVGCGKDTFMQLVAERLKDEYSIAKSVFAATFVHMWIVEQKGKNDIYSDISKATNVPRSDVKKVIYTLLHSVKCE